MACGVSRHVDHLKIQAKGCSRVAAVEVHIGLRNALGGRAIDLGACCLSQGIHTARVVCMVVRD